MTYFDFGCREVRESRHSYYSPQIGHQAESNVLFSYLKQAVAASKERFDKFNEPVNQSIRFIEWGQMGFSPSVLMGSVFGEVKISGTVADIHALEAVSGLVDSVFIGTQCTHVGRVINSGIWHCFDGVLAVILMILDDCLHSGGIDVLMFCAKNMGPWHPKAGAGGGVWDSIYRFFDA